LVYRAAAFTMEQGIARRIRVGAVRHRRRMPDARSRARYPAQQAKQPADVEQARGSRSSDSQPNPIILHLGLLHS
jgi:hypothetical protein